MRKSVSVLMSMLLVGTIAAGCSKGADSKVSETTKASTPQKEVVLKLWGGNDFLKGDDSPGGQMVKEFNEKNKGKIKVEIRYMPWAEFNTAMQAAFTSQDMPDLFALPQNMDLRQVIEAKWVRPLDGLVSDNWKKQFYPGSFSDGVNVIGGKTYSWPITGPELQQMLYINKDVLKKAGMDPEKAPETWDELRTMSKAVADKGKGDVFGLVFAGGQNNYLTNAVKGFAAGVSTQDAGGYNYKTGKYTFSTQAFTDSIKLLMDMKKDGSILPSSYTLKSAEAGVLFGSGKAAFLLDGRWRMWQIKRDTPDTNFGIAALPTPDGKPAMNGYITANYTSGFVVSATSKNTEAIGTFIEEGLASQSFYEKYMKSGVALTPFAKLNDNKSLYPYPEYATFVKLHQDLLRVRPEFSVRNPEAAKVIAEVGGADQPNVKPTMNDILQMLLTGAQKDADSLLKQYDEKLNKGLQDGINKMKQGGAKITPEEFIFPNWDPSKDYTDNDYKALKK
ncbi:extracellular solute-binding protein [Paenibacillus qinlingensis]|uniref:ABC-type glycerol-3-phosphate transport system substrate-binding protein n=1 Tax=Paenibacillus qinlingensis TaxID=1837343 RepID=A0ABU1NTN5_9BACL|nr:extracellular solute-binding protein [Paenibacillus qinlingensis]MDR6550846.1 ABC-type glycerol-3-phosphate transport system substrate-binding protein [Paenibacillus qinlingensis]